MGAPSSGPRDALAPPATRFASTDELDCDALPCSPPPALIGSVIDSNYTIRAVIGSGGMGQVYEAHDEALNRTVAIKMAWEHVDSDELLAEARALAAFRHPGVVAVHSIGRHDGRPYIVMERVYGHSLQEHLDKLARGGDRFSVAEAIDLLARICEVVATVHHAGILHSDLKPDNIVLAANQRVVLLDFGVFQPERWLADRPQLFATPDYAAPELVINEVQPGRGYLVDVYAVGVIAYEMLAGHAPYRGETNLQTMMKHVSEPVPSVAAERPDVPPWLDQLVSSMMAKDPLERPESMDSAVARLQAARRARRPHGESAPPTVLIVDDDDDFRAFVVNCVRRALPAVEVRTAVDGDDALEQIRQRPPHLMLTDLQMPGLNGVELCMYVRGTQLADRVPIVAMSAHADRRDCELLRQIGVARVLSKRPSEGKSFAESISQVVRETLLAPR